MNQHGEVLDESLLVVVHVQFTLIVADLDEQLEKVGEKRSKDDIGLAGEIRRVLSELLMIEQRGERSCT